MNGAVAAGHPLTCATAADILRAGGNAFDAAVGGFFTACVAEPVLASLGGGGFLLARDHAGREQVFDFFAHTPRARRHDDGDFHPVSVDFGNARQTFHIGHGTCAAPGTVRGMFAVHRELGSLPVNELIQPAVALAKRGVAVNDYQSYLLNLVGPIYRTDSALPLFESSSKPGELLQPGDTFFNPRLADALDTLSREGEKFFYQGELAADIVGQCSDGGCLTVDDLKNYRVHQRAPLVVPYRNHRLITNPPPSAGGLLIGFGLKLLHDADLGNYGSAAHLNTLINVMRATVDARAENFDDGPNAALLDAKLLAQYRRQVQHRARANRGTTHISVIDGDGNIASTTVTNGEGCGRLLAGAGFMLNNMLGEDDVNPGRRRWRADQRLSSMMAPGILDAGDGAASALGSGGSNRIRTAILQVVANRVDFKMDAAAAVNAPRIHIETDDLHCERLPASAARALAKKFPGHRVFTEPNMFFGGVHIAERDARGNLSAVGDPRRGGVGVVV